MCIRDRGSSAFLALVQAQRSGTWSERIAFDPCRQPEDAHLTALLANLPQGVTLVPIGAAEMAFCRKTPWAADFVNQFTEDEYARSGLGVLVCADGAFVSGASSYVAYPGGIEVEVDTAPAHRGYGYAALAAAIFGEMKVHPNATFRIPYGLGCGLAGGNWVTVLNLIEEAANAWNVNVEIWVLPQKKA